MADTKEVEKSILDQIKYVMSEELEHESNNLKDDIIKIQSLAEALESEKEGLIKKLNSTELDLSKFQSETQVAMGVIYVKALEMYRLFLKVTEGENVEFNFYFLVESDTLINSSPVELFYQKINLNSLDDIINVVGTAFGNKQGSFKGYVRQQGKRISRSYQKETTSTRGGLDPIFLIHRQTLARYGRFFDVINKGEEIYKQNQGGYLMWKENNIWNLLQLKNSSIIREGTMTAIILEAKGGFDTALSFYKGYNDPTIYGRHKEIGIFAKRFLTNVSNRSAINGDDVSLPDLVAMIKSPGAKLPGIMQYVELADKIVNLKPLSKKKLKTLATRGGEKNPFDTNETFKEKIDNIVQVDNGKGLIKEIRKNFESLKEGTKEEKDFKEKMLKYIDAKNIDLEVDIGFFDIT